MANKARLEFELNYKVNQQSLNQVRNALQSLNDIDIEVLSDRTGLNGNQLQKVFDDAIASANQLDTALNKAFDVDLGAINLTKFNQEIKSLDLNSIYTKMAAVGREGEEAFRKVAAAALNVNTQFKTTHTLLDTMKTSLANTIIYNISQNTLRSLTGSVQQAFGYVKNLDKSLNDIRIVTGMSADDMERFAVEANKAAISLSSSTKDIAEGALIYYQQGDTSENAMYKAQVTQKASNVSGVDASTMSDYLTAIWNGYQVAERAQREGMQVYDEYADKVASVAATTASDFNEVATAMGKVAPLANSMGISFDQLTAQISAVVSVTRQAPETVGTALRTIYTRMADLKAGGEDEGVNLGKVSGGLAKYGINVLDANKDLRDMGDVLDEVAAKWDTWDKATRQSIAVLVAGTRQVNIFTSLMDSWESQYLPALDTATNKSAGELDRMQSVYTESIEATAQRAKAAWEGVYGSLLDESAIKSFSQASKFLADGLKSIIDGLGGGSTVFPLLIGLVGQLTSGVISNKMAEIVMQFSQVSAQAQQIKAWKETVTTFQQSESKDVQQLANFAEQFTKFSSLMNEEQRERVSQLQKEAAALQASTNEYKAQLEAAKQLRSELPEETELGQTAKQIRELFAKGGTFEKGSQIARTPGASLDIIEKLSGLDQTNDIGEKIANLDALFKENTNNVEKRIAIYNELKEVLLDYANQLEKVENTIASEEIETQKAADAQENLNQRTKSFVNELDLANTIQTITNFTSSLTQLYGAYQAVQNLGSLWNNDDIGIGQKIFTTISSVTMMATQLMNVIKQSQGLSAMLSGLGNIFTGTSQKENLLNKQAAIGAEIEVKKQKQKELNSLIEKEKLLENEIKESNKDIQNVQEKRKQLQKQLQNTEMPPSVRSNLKEVFTSLKNIKDLTDKQRAGLDKNIKSLLQEKNLTKEQKEILEEIVATKNEELALQEHINDATQEKNAIGEQISSIGTDLDTLGSEISSLEGQFGELGQAISAIGPIAQLVGNILTGAFASNPIGLIIAAITTVVSVIGVLKQQAIEASKEIAENFNKAKEDFNETQNTLTEKQSQREENKKRIKALESQVNLTSEEQEELINLKAQNEELEHAVDLYETLLETKKAVLKESSEENFKRIFGATTWEGFLKAGSQGASSSQFYGDTGVFKSHLFFDEKGLTKAWNKAIENITKKKITSSDLEDGENIDINTTVVEIKNNLADIQKAKEEIKKALDSELIDNETYNKALENLNQAELSQKQSLLNVQEWLYQNKDAYPKLFNDFFDGIDKLINKHSPEKIFNDYWDSLANEGKERLKSAAERGIVELKKYYSQLPEEIKNEINDKSFITLVQRQIDAYNKALLDKQKLEDIKNTWRQLFGEINPKDLYEQLGLEFDEENPFKPIINGATDLKKALSSVTPKIKSLNEAIKEQNENGEISVDTYNNLIDAGVDVGKTTEIVNGKIKLKNEAAKEDLQATKDLIAATIEYSAQQKQRALDDLVVAKITEQLVLQEQKRAEYLTGQKQQKSLINILENSGITDLFSDADKNITENKVYDRIFTKLLENNNGSPLKVNNQNISWFAWDFANKSEKNKILANLLEVTPKYFQQSVKDFINAAGKVSKQNSDFINLSYEDIKKAAKEEYNYDEEFKEIYEERDRQLKQLELTFSNLSETAAETFKAQKESAEKIYNYFSVQLKDEKDSLSNIKTQIDDYYKEAQTLAKEGKYQEANDLLIKALSLSDEYKTRLSQGALETRKVNQETYSQLQNLLPNLFQNLSLQDFVDSNNFNEYKQKINDYYEQEIDKITKELNDDLSETAKQALYDKQTSLEFEKELATMLFSNLQEGLDFAGISEGQGEVGKLFKAVLSLEIDLQLEPFKNKITEINEEISAINDEISLLDKNDYIGKAQKIEERKQKEEELSNIYKEERQFLEDLENQGYDVSLQLKQLDKDERALSKSIKSTNEQLYEQIKALRSAGIAAEDALYSAIDDYHKKVLDDMQDEIDGIDDQIDKQKELNDERKKGIDEAKEALDKYKETLQKAWDAEDAQNERRKQLEERSEKAGERATQLTAAASGDLEALSRVQDLDKELAAIDEELQEDIVKDIRDKFLEFIEQQAEDLDRQAELLEEQINKLEDIKKTLEDQKDAIDKQYQNDLKNGIIGQQVNDFLRYGTPITIDGRTFYDIQEMYKAGLNPGDLLKTSTQEKLENLTDTFEAAEDFFKHPDEITAAIKEGTTEAFLALFGGDKFKTSNNNNFKAAKSTTSAAIGLSQAMLSTDENGNPQITLNPSIDAENQVVGYDFSILDGISTSMNDNYAKQNELLMKIVDGVTNVIPNINIEKAINVEGNIDKENVHKVQSAVTGFSDVLFNTIKKVNSSKGVSNQTKRY